MNNLCEVTLESKSVKGNGEIVGGSFVRCSELYMGGHTECVMIPYLSTTVRV